MDVAEDSQMDVVDPDDEMTINRLLGVAVDQDSISHMFEFHVAAFKNNLRSNAERTHPFSLCGGEALLNHPVTAIDEYTGEKLPPDDVVAGMMTELGQMSDKMVGRLICENEAKALCGQLGIAAIPSRWVLALKEKYGKQLVRARLVVQEVAAGAASAVSLGISSATVSTDAFKCLLAAAGHADQCLGALDASTAFMSAPLPGDIRKIIRLPSGIRDAEGRPLFLDLSKALNGLRCASRAWMLHLFNTIKSRFPGMEQSEVEPGLFVGRVSSQDGTIVDQPVTMITYVDDLLILTPEGRTFEWFLEGLQQEFACAETGRISPSYEGGGSCKFLGRIVHRKPNDSRLFVGHSQEYFEQLANLPMCKGIKPVMHVPAIKSMLDACDEVSLRELSEEAATDYRSALGRIAWVVNFRPDLAYPVSALSTGQAKPTIGQERALKALCRYVLGTAHFEMSFPSLFAESVRQEDMTEVDLITYTDASFAPLESNSRKSISGCCIFWLGSNVKSFARTQTVVSLSSTEAELQAILAGGQETLGLRQLTCFLVPGSEEYSRIFLMNDNSSAQAALLRQDVQRRLRHSSIRLHFLREHMNAGSMHMYWVAGEKNCADMLTKVLPSDKLSVFRAQTGVSDMEIAPFQFENASSKKKAGKGSKPVASPMEVDPSCAEEDEFMSEGEEDEFPMDVDFQDPMQVEVLSSKWTVTSGTRYLLVEVCCEPDSVLGIAFDKLGPEYAVWRVVEADDLCREATVVALLAALDRLQFRKESDRPAVWVHVSLPCTGGSSFMRMHDHEPGHRQTHTGLRRTFKLLLAKAKRVMCHPAISNWSFELSATCAYWKWRVAQNLRQTLPRAVLRRFDKPLIHVATARLCSSVESAGFSKRWRFISTSAKFADNISKLSECTCGAHTHALPNYKASGSYNKAVVKQAVLAINQEVRSPSAEQSHERVW